MTIWVNDDQTVQKVLIFFNQTIVLPVMMVIETTYFSHRVFFSHKSHREHDAHSYSSVHWMKTEALLFIYPLPWLILASEPL